MIALQRHHAGCPRLQARRLPVEIPELHSMAELGHRAVVRAIEPFQLDGIDGVVKDSAERYRKAIDKESPS
jgi:hypothetical protein